MTLHWQPRRQGGSEGPGVTSGLESAGDSPGLTHLASMISSVSELKHLPNPDRWCSAPAGLTWWHYEHQERPGHTQATQGGVPPPQEDFKLPGDSEVRPDGKPLPGTASPMGSVWGYYLIAM